MSTNNRVHVDGTGTIHLGDDLSITLQQTFRLPEDGKRHPLPPGYGPLPVHSVHDFAGKVPREWLQEGGVFVPLDPRQATWLGFQRGSRHPHHAVKVYAGQINAVTGKSIANGPSPDTIDTTPGAEQDYLVVPDQQWLDGFNTGKNEIGQFVATPKGMNYSPEAALTGKETYGGMQIVAFPIKADRRPKTPDYGSVRSLALAGSKGLAALESIDVSETVLSRGGRMTQAIERDMYGADAWDTSDPIKLRIRFVDHTTYRKITGRDAPDLPMSAKEYMKQIGIMWEAPANDDLPGSTDLAGVPTVGEQDAAHGFVGQQDDTPLADPAVVIQVGHKPGAVHGGSWDFS